jgi:hypothetical protein
VSRYGVGSRRRSGEGGGGMSDETALAYSYARQPIPSREGSRTDRHPNDQQDSPPYSIGNGFAQILHDCSRSVGMDLHRLSISLSTGTLAIYFLALTGEARPEIDITVDDPRAYTKPWSIHLSQSLAPFTELLEFAMSGKRAS